MSYITPSQVNKRFIWLDSLKGVLITLVVIAHAIANVIGNDAANINYWWCLIYSFHMPAFMAVSGYLTYRQNVAGQINVLSSVSRRFQQLLVPFLVWSGVYFAIRESIASYISCILMPNTTFWFLWALFFISVLFVSFQYISNRVKINIDYVLVAACVVFAAVLVVFKDIHYLGIQYILYYFLFYVMGYFIHKRNITSDKVAVMILLFAFWFLLASFWRPNALPDFIPLTGSAANMLRFIYKFLVAAVAVVFLFSFSPIVLNGDNKFNRVLVWLGKYSLGIYVIHLTFIKLISNLVAHFVVGENAQIWVLSILLLLISAALIWLLNKNKWTARLLLGKF